MTSAPVRLYARWLGWGASALRRLAVAGAAGVVVAGAVVAAGAWQLGLLVGWNATALAFLLTIAPILLRADAEATAALAVREDLNREIARLVLLAASTASLVAVGLALELARRETGMDRALLLTLSAATVVVSWTVVNTLFTLRYAHLYYRLPADGIDFGDTSNEPPDFRDFAYLAFTIGMTYQVSDTVLRSRRVRRTVLVHALISYVFGVVIVAAGVNTVAGLL